MELDMTARATAEKAVTDAVVKQVDDNLRWNVSAYGKAWTGEGEDSAFIAGVSIGADVITALEDEGFRVVLASEVDRLDAELERRDLADANGGRDA
jgi:hypothetical protein